MAEKKNGFFAEFKKFITRGNVLDMAVGVVVGGAFTSIVNSLVNDLIMPLISILTGGINFSDWKIVIKPATETTAETAFNYGNFIATVINFLLIALVLFTIIREINKVHDKLEKKEEEKPAPAPQPSEEVILLREIRDSLKK